MSNNLHTDSPVKFLKYHFDLMKNIIKYNFLLFHVIIAFYSILNYDVALSVQQKHSVLI